MALDLTEEQKDLGRKNFQAASDEVNRRTFMGVAAGAAAALPLSAGVYFGYQSLGGKPVKAALIGCGDEGGVLMGEHNPQYLQFIAGCDIRPFNKNRILNGDPKVPLRKGFIYHYGKEKTKEIGEKHFYEDYKEMLDKEKDIEAVVIALPLHLHAPVAIECMKRGKHVLCEKLMAHDIAECKAMIKAAKDNNVILSIGHQRHYSMLYAHALEVVNSGIIGDIKHIRALWHRNNSWPAVPEANWAKASEVKQPVIRDGWYPPILQEDYDALVPSGLVEKFGYKDIGELIRWRIFNRTGGGLMAELGSHQLDACSIFLGKVKPIAVMGAGTKAFYGPGKNERDADDHVFVTFEFPGKNHPMGANKGTDKNDIVIVTYSSISTNGFEKYGECLMGSRGTMVVETESDVFLYKEAQPGKPAPENDPKKTAVAVTSAGGGKPAMEASSTWGGPSASAVKAEGGPAAAPVSRGYREEMEHFAYCIRKWDKSKGYAKDDKGKYVQDLPRCHGEVAMADAILALTANLAMEHHERIEFKPEWFDSDKPDVPETKYQTKKLA
ncbi:MAG: Gfo/Idh/MocA family protein [Fimbriiglobus sp.]